MEYKDENKNLIEYRAEVAYSRRGKTPRGEALCATIGLDLFDITDVEGESLRIWDTFYIKHAKQYIATAGRVKHAKFLRALRVPTYARPMDLLGKQCIVTLRPYRGVPHVKAYKHFNNTIGEAK